VTLATTIDPSLNNTLPKARKLSPRVMVWMVVLICLIVGMASAGYLLIRWRMSSPETVALIEWPEPAAPSASVERGLTPRNGRALRPAPDPRLIEALPVGLLPKIGDDGARPSDIYARPILPVSGAMADAPRIAILLTGGGIGHLATVEAMVKLPPDISIALSPYSVDIDRQAADIRSEGHEIFLDLPVSQPDQPYGGAGPIALGDQFDTEINQSRLRWAMARFPGYIGVAGHFQDRIKGTGAASAALSEIAARGLAMFDVAGGAKPVTLDSDLRSKAIDDALQSLEDTARQSGTAIGLAGTTPLAIDRLKNWSASLAARGFRLVPVSTLLHDNGAK
jgi:polysaccharide deacetylase 2 family uncharacterized protein YibQ